MVSMKERESAADYAPLAKTTPSLSKVLPVFSVQANPSTQLNDELILAPSWLPERCEPHVINTKSAVSKSTHLMDEIHPRASSQAGNPQFGIPHTARESVQCKRTIEAKETSPLLPESPSINTPTHSSDTLGLVSAPEYIPSPSSELGEKWRDSNTVINIHNECEETSSSNNTAALSLPIPFPAAHSLPPLSPLQFVDGPIHAEPSCEPMDECKPPIEVVP